jgi:limonene-1,2-epoxide hydrolase
MSQTGSNDNVALVKDFFASIDKAITDKDPVVIEKLFGLIADDIRYRNKPQRLVEGKDDFVNWFMEYIACDHMRCNVLRAAADGDWVLTERRDTWTMNGVKVTMELMGSLEVRDGQIHTWIDYISDREQWEASGQMPEGFFRRWASDEVVYEKV